MTMCTICEICSVGETLKTSMGKSLSGRIVVIPCKIQVIGILLLSLFSVPLLAEEGLFNPMAGASVMSFPGSYDNASVRPGWNLSTAITINQRLAVVFDGSGYYSSVDRGDYGQHIKAHDSLYLVLMGPRFKIIQTPKLAVFAHFLLGPSHATQEWPVYGTDIEVYHQLIGINKRTDLGLGFAFGGGIDLPISKHCSFGLIQGSLLSAPESEQRNWGVRFSTGIVWHLGKQP
jgi:hypothetical protein